MKHWRLNQPQGWHGNPWVCGEQRRQVALQALLDEIERLERFFTIARQQVEPQLRVENVGFQFLERQHGHRLLLQFFQTAMAAFARGLKNVNHRTADGAALRQAHQQHRQCDRRRMRDHVNPRCDSGARWRFRGGRAQPRVDLLVKRRGEIDQRGPVRRIQLERPAAGRGRPGQKCYARAVQTFGRQRNHDDGAFLFRAQQDGAVHRGRDQLKARRGFGFAEQFTQFLGQQRISADHGHHGAFEGASQFDAPAAEEYVWAGAAAGHPRESRCRCRHSTPPYRAEPAARNSRSDR